jgi:hypothetical protein
MWDKIEMDTLHLGIRFKYETVDKYKKEYERIEEVINKVNKKNYSIKYLNFKSSKKRDAPEYLRKIRITSISNPKQYILFQFFRVNGYPNSFDFKVISDLSNFSSFKEFITFFIGIGNGTPYWRYLIDISEITSIHFKVDVNAEFDFFRQYLLYPNGEKTRILESYETKRRTFYLTDKFYIYEKTCGVRLERRFVGKREVLKLLGTQSFKHFSHNQMNIRPFGDITFCNISSFVSCLNKQERECLNKAIGIVNRNDFEVINTKKGNAKEYKNSLVNARHYMNSNYNYVFSQKLQPKIPVFNIDINLYFELEKQQFFR